MLTHFLQEATPSGASFASSSLQTPLYGQMSGATTTPVGEEGATPDTVPTLRPLALGASPAKMPGRLRTDKEADEGMHDGGAQEGSELEWPVLPRACIRCMHMLP